MNDLGLFIESIRQRFEEVIHITRSLDGADYRTQTETKWREFIAQMVVLMEERFDEVEKDKQRKILKWSTIAIARIGTPKTDSTATNSEMEKEINDLKKQIVGLQCLLNPMDGLEWDGTLEDAEKKMAFILELDSSKENDKNYTRYEDAAKRHPDFKKREETKWTNWEKENEAANDKALEEMKKMVPPEIMTTATVDSLMKNQGLTQKVAQRIHRRMIFRVLYIKPEVMCTMHVKNLSINYTHMGLDIRELRAVYTSLPKQLDTDNDRREWRINIRTALFHMTTKEKAGTLLNNEKLALEYRDTSAAGGVTPRVGTVVASPVVRTTANTLFSPPTTPRTPIARGTPLDMSKFGHMKPIKVKPDGSLGKPPIE
jgi:hypothetical protein